MPPPTDIGRRWCLADTPDPHEVTLVTFVDRYNVALRDIPVVGSTFKLWTQAYGFTELVAAHGNWTFAQMKTQDAPGQMNAFYWVRPRTATERQTPFRTSTKFGNHRWPPILKELSFSLARDFPLVTQAPKRAQAQDSMQTVFANRYLVREVYIPEVNEGSRFEIEEFTSDTPFDIPQHPVPTTTSVTYNYLNIRGGFPECLHKRIDIGNLISTVASYGNSTITDTYNELRGQVFPATNFTEWAPYVVSDEQEFVNGVWYRRRIRVYPPAVPETITNKK